MLITMDKMTCKPSVKCAVINSIRNPIPTRIIFFLLKFLLHPALWEHYIYLSINISFICSFFRLLAVPVLNVIQKYLRVDVSSGSYICQLPNPYEKD